MKNYKITNLETKVIQYFNYDELQQFMRINRKNFFNKKYYYQFYFLLVLLLWV